MVHVHVSAVADPGAKVEECTPYTVARSYVTVQYLPNRGMRGAIDPVVAVSLNERTCTIQMSDPCINEPE